MLEHMTAAQMAMKVGISERSIQHWIQEGRLQAKRIEDSALYEVETDDLDRLRLRSHREEESRLQAVERKVTEMAGHLDTATFRYEEQFAALERKFNDQAEQIAQLSAALHLTTEQGQAERLRVEALEHLEDQTTERGRLDGVIEDLRERVDQMEDHIRTIEAELHDIRVVYLSKLMEYDPQRLRALSTRMEALESRLATTSKREASPRAQPARPVESSSESSELPEGLVVATTFARQYGISDSTIKKVIATGRVTPTGAWPMETGPCLGARCARRVGTLEGCRVIPRKSELPPVRRPGVPVP